MREFDSLTELQGMTLEELEELQGDLENQVLVLQAKKESTLTTCRELGEKLDQKWMHRISLKTRIQKRKANQLADHIRRLKGYEALGAFKDIAKAVLDEEVYRSIQQRAARLAEHRLGGGEE